MYTYNDKMLKLIFGGYALIVILNILLNLLLIDGFNLSYKIGNIIYYATEFSIICLLAGSAITGSRSGINLLGRIGAWTAIPSIILSLALNYYLSTLYEDYYINSDIISFIHVVQFIFSILILSSI